LRVIGVAARKLKENDNHHIGSDTYMIRRKCTLKYGIEQPSRVMHESSISISQGTNKMFTGIT